MSNVFDNQRHKTGKKVILSKLRDICSRLDRAHDAFHCAKLKHKTDPQTGKSPIEMVQSDMMAVGEQLSELMRNVQSDLASETTLESEYTKEMIEKSLKFTHHSLMERFKHQPNISATLSTTFLLIESNMALHAHFLNLRGQCQDHTNCGIDGKPK